MRVLLSIKPEYAARIFDGTKRYEYRRVIFKRPEVTTVVVYVSNPVKKVIGEFEIGEILHEDPHSLWAKTGQQAGITQEKFLTYFDRKSKGYAIGVKEPKKYHSPFSLGALPLTCPPQSFAYL